MTHHDASADPLTALTDGDDEAAGRWRENLVRLARIHAGTPTARTISRVLAGDAPPTTLRADQDFVSVIRAGVAQYQEAVQEMSPELPQQWRESVETAKVAPPDAAGTQTETDDAHGSGERPGAGPDRSSRRTDLGGW